MKHPSLSYRSIPWPMPKDKLFKEDSDWRHTARLNLGGKGWESYSTGYKEAADSLARRFIRKWQGNDILTYPMVFLYRHYLELRLKQVIILGQELLDEPISIQQKILENHWLNELWKPCREILEKLAEEEFWPKDPVEELDRVERLVDEFHTNDPDNINFRYPVTKKSKGSQPTLPHLNCVGVRNLYKIMQRLDSFFVAQIEGIGFYLHQCD
jgi:hypothetical protein